MPELVRRDDDDDDDDDDRDKSSRQENSKSQKNVHVLSRGILNIYHRQ